MFPALAAARLLLSAAPAACSGLDLPAALQAVVERSDEVAIKVLERSSAEADLSLARAIGFVPEANVTVTGGAVPGAHGNILQAQDGYTNRSLQDLGPFVRLDANIVQPVWTWGQLDGARDAASAGVAARGALIADAVSQVQLRVARLFWGHALAQKLISITGSVDKALLEVDQRLAQAIANNDATISPNDRYRVEVFKTELLRRKADAAKALRMTEVGIAATLSMDTTQLQLADIRLPSSHRSIPDLSQVVEMAERQRPDLLAVSHAIDARKAQVSAAEGARLPQIFLAGQFSFAYAGNRDLQTNPWVYDPFREVSGGVVLGARQDLAIHVKTIEADKARAEVAVLERQQAALRRLVRAQVESAHAELVASAARNEASVGGAATAKAWFRAVEMNFGVGVEDARTLIDSYTAFVESQVLVATTSYDALVARAQLDQAAGSPLARSEGSCVRPELP